MMVMIMNSDNLLPATMVMTVMAFSGDHFLIATVGMMGMMIDGDHGLIATATPVHPSPSPADHLGDGVPDRRPRPLHLLAAEPARDAHLERRRPRSPLVRRAAPVTRALEPGDQHPVGQRLPRTPSSAPRCRLRPARLEKRERMRSPRPQCPAAAASDPPPRAACWQSPPASRPAASPGCPPRCCTAPIRCGGPAASAWCGCCPAPA